MKTLVLYCKSWRQDVLRARRLAESVSRHNGEQLEFHISAPTVDHAHFREHLAGVPHVLHADEDILAANPRLDRAQVAAMPGYVSQQVVKSEFWRLGLAEHYVCLDSDSYFIRDFGLRDFVAGDGTPYTVMHEDKDFFQYLINIGKQKFVAHAQEEARRLGEHLPGVETRYRFGPTPVIWSRHVWEALDERKFRPAGMSFADAIARFASELHWYGGALLAYKPIPLLPREPLFRLYGYVEEYWRAHRLGETDETLKAQYLGVTRQSSWDRADDFEPVKRIRRAARTALKYCFGRW
ncbi:MAG TPA: DUF6492 family protein [Verrucomicrobiae bacterium]|nr:DUF6492 family protein [Verrucomicrobiae bacterium]